MPQYVVYLTEQETLGVIRAQLEEAGLNFDGEPPLLQYYDEWLEENRLIQTALFDEQRRVAVLLQIMDEELWRPKNSLAFRLNQQHNDLIIGGFDVPGRGFLATPSDEELEQARGQNFERLAEDVQNFIRRLENEGILP